MGTEQGLETGNLQEAIAKQRAATINQYTERLDGEPWGEFTSEGAEWQDEIVFGADGHRGVQSKMLEVVNEVSVFSPFRIGVIGQDAKNFSPNIQCGTLDSEERV